ncbi:MAG: ribonuclease HII, partial [Cyanobacteriota bacterium]
MVLPRSALGPLAAAGLTDSKRLSPRQRAELVPRIEDLALAWGIGQARAADVDRFGIRPATEHAMRRALARLGVVPRLVIVDGALPLRGWPGEQRTLVSGDR